MFSFCATFGLAIKFTETNVVTGDLLKKIVSLTERGRESERR